jgi:hypothetical protein
MDNKKLRVTISTTIFMIVYPYLVKQAYFEHVMAKVKQKSSVFICQCSCECLMRVSM